MKKANKENNPKRPPSRQPKISQAPTQNVPHHGTTPSKPTPHYKDSLSMQEPPPSVSHSSSLEKDGFHIYQGWIRGAQERADEELVGFDADPRFGPCKGIRRQVRWENSENLGLKPPKEIPNLI